MLMTVMLLGVASLWARPGYTKPVDVYQPDGTTVTLLMRGDEYLSFMTTIDGYTVVKGDDGYYRYAERQGEGLKATSVIARNPESRTAEEAAYLSGVNKNIHPQLSETARQWKEQAAQMVSPRYSQTAAQGHKAPPSIWPLINYDNFKGLVVLVNWNDCQFTMSNPQEFYKTLTSQKNLSDASRAHYPVDVEGSVRDYFYDNSMGKFDPQFDVVGPVTINYSCTYPAPPTASGADDSGYFQRMINIVKAVMTQVDQTVNFADYDLNSDGKIDMVYFIFAGYGSYVQGNDDRYIWPHANDWSSISSWYSLRYDNKRFGRYACSVEFQDYEAMAASHQYYDGIGTMCHEFSHVLGLADHYDTDYETNGESNHPDRWDVMAGGADENYGLTPVGYNLFERYMLTFAEPQELTAAGSYQLNAFATGNEGYILHTGKTNEDFYLENRQQQGWDRFLPGHGLLAWRADVSKSSVWTGNTVNDNASHMYFELLCATPGKSLNSAYTPFPGQGGVMDLTASTSPALKAWSGETATLDLYDIAEDGGVITFTAGKDVYPSLVEDFEATPLGDDAKGVAGVFCQWDLDNAAIEATSGSYGNGSRVAKIGRNGTLTSSALSNNVRNITFSVQNGSSGTIRFSLKYSTDGGTTWTTCENTDGQAQVEIKKNKDAQPVYRNIPAGSKIQLTMLGTSNSAVCYVDDITVSFGNEATGVETLTADGVDRRSGHVYNLAGQRVGDGYKGLVIKNGRKFVVK